MNFREHLALSALARKRFKMSRAIEKYDATLAQNPVCPGCGERHPPVSIASILRMAQELQEPEPIAAPGSTKLN